MARRKSERVEVRVAVPGRDFAAIAEFTKAQFREKRDPEYVQYGSLPLPLSVEALEAFVVRKGATVFVAEVGGVFAGFGGVYYGAFELSADQLQAFGADWVSSRAKPSRPDWYVCTPASLDFEAGKEACVEWLWIHPDFRGKKVGSKLLRAMLRFLKGRGIKEIWTEVDQDNTGELEFFKGAGFKMSEEQDPEDVSRVTRGYGIDVYDWLMLYRSL